MDMVDWACLCSIGFYYAFNAETKTEMIGDNMSKQQWIQLATVFGLPFVMALLKRFLPMIPKQAIPVVCPILGAVVDVISSGTIGANTAWGAAMGSAAVGLREVYDQLSGNAAKPSSTPTEPQTSTDTKP